MGTGYTRASAQIQGLLWTSEDLRNFDAYGFSLVFIPGLVSG